MDDVDPRLVALSKQSVKDAYRIAELEQFAEWVKRHATEQAKARREAGLDDIAWCKVVDQANAVAKSTT